MKFQKSSAYVVPPKEAALFGESFTFRLRQHTAGNFRGLWELTTLNDQGQTLKIISDADSLQSCIDNMVGEMEEAGH